MSSLSWSEHVKAYREKHNCTYKVALQKASETYVKKVKPRKPRKPSEGRAQKEITHQPVLEVSVPVHEPVEQPAQPPSPKESDEALAESRDESIVKSLKKYKKAELIAMCDTLGINTKGTIKQLSERITEAMKK